MRRALSIAAVTVAGAALMTVTSVAALNVSATLADSGAVTQQVVAGGPVDPAAAGLPARAGTSFSDPVIERAIASLSARAAAPATSGTSATPVAPAPQAADATAPPAGGEDDHAGSDRESDHESDD